MVRRLRHPKVLESLLAVVGLPTKSYNPTDVTTKFKLNYLLCFKIQGKKKKKSVREIKIKKKKIQSTLSISTSILEICLLGSSKAKAQAHYKTITLVYRPNRNAHT